MVTLCPPSILSRATQAAVISILRLVVFCSPPLISSPLIPSSLYALARLGPQQPDDQVQPLDLAPCMLKVEIRPRPDALQAAMLIGVQQAVEVEARRPLVLGLQDGLCIVQADPPDILGQLAVGAY